MRRSRTVWTTVLAALVVAMSACTDAPVERGGGIRASTVTVGFVDRAPDIEGEAGPAFLAALADRSAGALRPTAVPRVGEDARSVVNDVVSGDLDAAWLRTDALEAAGIGRMSVLQAPFLITTSQEQELVSESGAAQMLLDSLLEPAGVVGLALWGGPLRRPIAAVEPLLGLESWSGRRVRSLSPTQSEAFEALGAVPIEVTGDMNQLVPAGTVDAAETDLPRQLVAADVTIAPYVTDDVVLWSRFSVLLANREWFTGLRDEEQGWVRAAAESARLVSFGSVEQDTETATRLCEDGARFPSIGPRAGAALERAVAPVLDAMRSDPVDGPLLVSVEHALAGAPNGGTVGGLPVPAWCRGSVSPLQTVDHVPHTRPPLPPGTYRTHLTAEDIAAAGVGKVHDAQVVTLVINADGSYTNTSRFDDDGSVMVFEAGILRGDDRTLYFVNDLERLRALAESGVSACVWTDPGLGCITNSEPYSVQWELLDDGSIRLSDPVGVDPDPVLVLTIVANPYRRVPS